MTSMPRALLARLQHGADGDHAKRTPPRGILGHARRTRELLLWLWRRHLLFEIEVQRAGRAANRIVVLVVAWREAVDVVQVAQHLLAIGRALHVQQPVADELGQVV